MNNKEIIRYAQASLLKAGAQKTKCNLIKKEKQEFNVAAGEISLFRTTFDTNLYLTALVDDKKGTVTLNNLDMENIDISAKQAVEMAISSKADKANEIAEQQPANEFVKEPTKPDLDKMYDRLVEFMAFAKEKHPKTIIEEINFDFTTSDSYLINSNGVDYFTKKGIYTFVVMFTSKEGKKTSSFNYVAHVTKELDKPFSKCGNIDKLLRESGEQLETKSIPENFVGDMIITPECLDEFVSYITGYLADYPLITKTSVFKDKLGKQIAKECFNLHSKPISDEIATSYYVTGDGYEAKDSTVIENGILKTFLLGLYGAKKTGEKRAVGSGCWEIDKGDKTLEEIIKSTKKGIILNRFSGGSPSDNGDFSGIAKNSYYVENGKIQFPISETMINGNLIEMMMNIEEISKERVNSGYNNYPWIKFNGLAISGK
ncbi:MAG: TldD/PmbA family protein [Candidatus Cloacimonadota bacterium]|nr:TldD/PmbA family protein [Candidatus Cloacimonadota bacterium]